MNHTCPIPSHNQKAIAMICSSLECKNTRRLMCLSCLVQDHQACIKDVLEIEDVLKGDLKNNLNWIKDQEIKSAVALINKYNVNNQVDVLKTSEKRVNEEFTKLKEHINEKVNESREKVIKNLRERQNSDVQVNLKAFTKRMEELYGFDTLAGIMESVRDNKQTDIETLNVVLNSFFTSINDKKSGADAEFVTKGKILGQYLKDMLELDNKVFERVKENLKFSVFDNYMLGRSSWEWNVNNKADGIEISENNTLAKKNGNVGYAAVGTLEMANGRHVWELDINTFAGNGYWIAFGIVEKSVVINSLAANKVNFCYTSGIGIDTEGGLYSTCMVSYPAGYDNRTYVCELDLDKETFTISTDGTVIAKNMNAISGKTYYPYIYLWSPGDSARLRVLN